MAKLLIFDKDGVLLDLEATWLPVAQAVAKYTAALVSAGSNVGPTITAVDLLRAVGVDESCNYIDPRGLFAIGSFTDMRAKWQTMLPANSIMLDRDPVYLEAVRNIVLKEARQTTKAKGDVATPLRALRKEGYVLAVVTNDDEDSARQNLHDLGISSLFCSVVGADSGHGSKPEPYGLLHCCDVAGLGPKDSIMVGDTIADYGAALAAGCQDFICIASNPELRPHDDIQPEHVISSLMGLPPLLKTLANRLHI